MKKGLYIISSINYSTFPILKALRRFARIHQYIIILKGERTYDSDTKLVLQHLLQKGFAVYKKTNFRKYVSLNNIVHFIICNKSLPSGGTNYNLEHRSYIV